MDRSTVRECGPADLAESLGPEGLGLDWLDFEAELRAASHGLATATLTVLLLCATREAMAQTGAAPAPATRSIELVAVAPVNASVMPPVDAPVASSTPAPPTMIRRVRELDALLAVRRHAASESAQAQTDAAIAEAVALGLERDLERKSGFRKKSNDLFQTQREVEIGNREMLLRLRLRAKAREAMAVELRF